MLADPGGGAFAGFTTAVDAIATYASSGGFGISQDGGQALINAIDELKSAVETALGHSSFLGQEPALGSTPAAGVYKPFLATVATDPVQGAVPALRKLQTDLTNAHAAIQRAMQNYQATEEHNTGIWT